MKLKITFKDPDGVYECVRDAAQETLPEGLSEEETDELLESRTESTFNTLRKWIEWKEYLSVEFDTDTGTATVLPVKA
jgi:hypothetical protein